MSSFKINRTNLYIFPQTTLKTVLFIDIDLAKR